MKNRPSLVGIATATTYAVVLMFCSGAAYLYGRDSYRAERDVEIAVATARDSAVLDESAEIEALRKQFGPTRNSYNAEEWIVRDFFGTERNGVFVDVGANHHQRYSNTFYLETALGWSGLAFEPQRKFAKGYEQYRPRTTFIPLFVSDASNREATLYVGANDLVASSSSGFTGSFGDGATPTQTTTTTLDAVLDRLRMTRVDFLTMDIELAEPEALAGFSIRRFQPRLVCVEAHEPVRQKILAYFAKHGYVMVGKYWAVDRENFWFTPMELESR